MPWKCPICGTENPDDVDTCRICGAARPTASTVSVAERGPKVVAYYRQLVVEILETPVKGLAGAAKAFDLEALGNIVTVGRALDNNFVLPDPSVSRRHLRIVVSSEGLILEDLGSTNGTYLMPEGKRVNVAKAGEEAVVKIGNSVVRLRLVK
ncbi:FHA domain containing protein [Thermoproteus uzoniensis 768-20]|jgi:hypothetical protein|uniref:FHA domain containing protein n=1 Tax=Thermoproteus uzoniensis (strain 768-20) TaxID=999630 RepID=F2L2K2_THEU7|nr:FHA domain containing protein [Thermoproteus uzoniensis 768-20]